MILLHCLFWSRSLATGICPYRIKLEWWLFALAGGLVLSTALLIIGARALQAALNNPVKALRTE
ncbi:MAG: hypothetical protein IPF93_15105 [Saprospiraceae bacterium]|nr:hypothetical protein [Saprospiraceae bacterium]